jgi:histidine triad (HIT) family protein
MDCLGCRLANAGEPAHIVFENEYVCCIFDMDPFNEGHTLLLPKRHVVEWEELDTQTSLAIIDASQKLAKVVKRLFNPDGVTICQNGGKFNDLTHLHIHLIPRYAGDGFSWGEPVSHHGAEHRLHETKQRMVEIMLQIGG